MVGAVRFCRIDWMQVAALRAAAPTAPLLPGPRGEHGCVSGFSLQDLWLTFVFCPETHFAGSSFVN